ncbi:hypothetical protein Bbelb_004060 [Branchiostoma belcheri]|nr:hypothetical protein Bbelb_004060 [Branchiostoma belcheri]
MPLSHVIRGLQPSACPMIINGLTLMSYRSDAPKPELLGQREHLRSLNERQAWPFAAIVIVVCCILLGVIYNDGRKVELEHKKVELQHKVVEYKRKKVEAIENILTATDTLTREVQESGWLWGVGRITIETIQKLRMDIYIPVALAGWAVSVCLSAGALAVVRASDKKLTYFSVAMGATVIYSLPIILLSLWRTNNNELTTCVGNHARS